MGGTRVGRAAWSAVLTVPALLLVTGCGDTTTETSLEAQVVDLDGVLGVEAISPDGDDGLLGKPSWSVEVVMSGDASVDDVRAVLDAYADDVDGGGGDGDLDVITVVLGGATGATLVSRLGTLPTDQAVADLVAAAGDPEVVGYQRDVSTSGSGVNVDLAGADLDRVLAVADRYHGAGLHLVQVEAGPFLVVYDDVNADGALEDARVRYVRDAAVRLRLTGAVVTGRGPMALAVAPEDRDAATAAVRRDAARLGLGGVVIGTEASTECLSELVAFGTQY